MPDATVNRRHPGADVALEGFVFRAFDFNQKIEREFTVAAACGSTHGKFFCVRHSLSFVFQDRLGEHTATRGVSRCLLVFECAHHHRPETVKPVRRREVKAEARGGRG